MSTKPTLVFSCTHAPAMHQDFIPFLKKIYKKHKCGRVVHLGDAVDWNSISFHEKDPSMPSAADEFLAAKKQMQQIYKAFPKLDYMMGNHCFDEATEVATLDGWKSIKEVGMHDYVGQWEDGVISYDKPLALHKNKHSENLVSIEGAHTKQVVTRGHDVLLDGKKVKAESLIGKTIKRHRFIHQGERDDNYGASLNFIRLLTWFIMDGTLVDSSIKNPKHTKCRLQWKLSKTRKIERLRKLLDDMKIQYTFREATKGGCNVLQPYYITIYGDYARLVSQYLDKKKELPTKMIQQGCAQFDAFLETLEETDGSPLNGGVSWTTISKNDVDVVQQWATNCGHECSYKLVKKSGGFKNAKQQYIVSIRRSVETQLNAKITEIPYDGDVYCVTMPQGTLITRIDGKVAITGNCSLPERKAKMIGLPEEVLCDFAKLWDVSGWTIHPRYSDLVIDDVIFRHGDKGKGGAMAAHKNAIAEFASVVQGHFHAQAGIVYHANKGDCVYGLQVGCGVDRKHPAMNYGRVYAAKPIVGCGVVYSSKLAFFEPAFL